jgi:hypothetical protein
MLLGRREHGRHGPCSRQVTIRKRSNEEVRTSQLAGCPPDRRLSAVWTSLQWRRTPDHRASLMGLQSRARDPDTVSPKRRRALRLGDFLPPCAVHGARLSFVIDVDRAFPAQVSLQCADLAIERLYEARYAFPKTPSMKHQKNSIRSTRSVGTEGRSHCAPRGVHNIRICGSSTTPSQERASAVAVDRANDALPGAILLPD